MRGTFPARFNSACIACESRIHEGDLVKWADDAVIHADCMVLDDNMREVRPACPRCFMVPAVNGECGCES